MACTNWGLVRREEPLLQGIYCPVETFPVVWTLSRGENKTQAQLPRTVTAFTLFILVAQVQFRHTSFYCGWFYWAFQIIAFFFFLISRQTKTLWQPHEASLFIGPLSTRLWSWQGSRPHLSNSHRLSSILVMTGTVIWDPSAPMLLLSLFLRATNHAHIRWQA